MIPPSTTISEEGRRIRQRVVWGVGVVIALGVLSFVFLSLDRSTVVDGPAGTTYATTATGAAALFDTLDRAGRDPGRIRTPLSTGALAGLDSYVIADIGFERYAPEELHALEDYALAGGTIVVLGVPPEQLTDTFDLTVEWIGSPAGVVPTVLDAAPLVDGSRFGSFAPDHGGTIVAGDDDAHLVVEFDRGLGRIVLVADSSLAHNATISRADNVDLLGELLGTRPGFDEYRHGYAEGGDGTGLIEAAPGNWEGALLIGVAALGLALLSYGRRVHPVEPTGRDHVPERVALVDAVARSLRRTGDPLPTEPLVSALGIAESAHPDDPWELDAMLADQKRRRT